MTEAFRVTLFYGNRDSNQSKELGVFIDRVSNAQLLAKTTCVVFIVSREQLQNFTCCTALTH